MPIPGGQILVAFANRPGSSGNVLLEQEPWDKYVGYLTRAGAVAWLDAMLYGDPEEDLTEHCGIDTAGNVAGVVYAYPEPVSLNYLAGISHGRLGPRRIDKLPYSEVLQVQLETEPALKYPTDKIFSAEWLTDAFTNDGATLPRPAVDISGKRPRIAGAIFGSLLVVYEVVRHTYTVTISARPASVEKAYQSHVYAVWDGGTRAMEYQPPDEAAAGGRCNGRYGVGTINDSPYDPPTVQPKDIERQWDYCSNSAVEE